MERERESERAFSRRKKQGEIGCLEDVKNSKSELEHPATLVERHLAVFNAFGTKVAITEVLATCQQPIEKERERKMTQCVRKRERESLCVRVCVCVCECARECVCT